LNLQPDPGSKFRQKASGIFASGYAETKCGYETLILKFTGIAKKQLLVALYLISHNCS
jgi:hypothetical protein